MPKNKKESYDIREIYEQMELDMIRSMKRNLVGHEIEEHNMGFKFEQWQSAKLRDMERYRQENKEIIGEHSGPVERLIDLTLLNTYNEAQDKVNKFIKEIRNEYVLDAEFKLPGDLKPILDKAGQGEAIKDTVERVLDNAKKWQEAPRPIDEVFFRANDRKFDALRETVQSDFKNANAAVMRRMDDVYRQTLYKTQVFYNRGNVALDKAIDMATKDFLRKGIDCITYKDGKKVNIATYAEMALRTANHRAYLMGEGKKRQEIGLSFVVVSAHNTACELCIPWQGQILIDDVYSGGQRESGPYPLLSKAMKYGFLH